MADELVLTPGQAGDCPVAAQLLGHLREDTIVLADKAYDADWMRLKKRSMRLRAR
jgi:transposase